MLPIIGDPAGALQNYRAALAIRQELVAADPTNAPFRRDLAVGHRKVGLMLAATGDQASALQSYQAALALRQELAAADPQNATARTDLARIYGDIGPALAIIGDLAGAVESFRTALAIFDDLAAKDSTNMERRTDVSQTLTRLAALSVQTRAARGGPQLHQACDSRCTKSTRTGPPQRPPTCIPMHGLSSPVSPQTCKIRRRRCRMPSGPSPCPPARMPCSSAPWL